MIPESVLNDLAGPETVASADASTLWDLAQNFDRWGLALEAEVVRFHYRRRLIDDLRDLSNFASPSTADPD